MEDPLNEDEPRPFLTLADGVWFGFVQAVVWGCFGVGFVADAGVLRLLGLWVWCGTFFLGLVWVVRYPWRRRTALSWLLLLGPVLMFLVSETLVELFGAPVLVPTLHVIRDG